MFTGDEVVLDVSLAVARARLAHLTRDDLLRRASDDAYGAGMSGLTQVGALGLTKVVQVLVREIAETDGSARFAVRWEATGPGGGLFPTLDADIRLLATGEQTTSLSLSGVYRPPLGSLGAVLDRAACTRWPQPPSGTSLTGWPPRSPPRPKPAPRRCHRRPSHRRPAISLLI
jgi:hypothetical protein